MPGIDFRAVRQLVSMSDVLQLIGFQPRTRAGPQCRGPCPVHRSRSATSRSLEVHLQRQVYHCFVCGSAGNHLDLYAAATRQRLYDAAVDLCVRLGRDVPWLHRRSRVVPTVRPRRISR